MLFTTGIFQNKSDYGWSNMKNLLFGQNMKTQDHLVHCPTTNHVLHQPCPMVLGTRSSSEPKSQACTKVCAKAPRRIAKYTLQIDLFYHVRLSDNSFATVNDIIWHTSFMHNEHNYANKLLSKNLVTICATVIYKAYRYPFVS